jgi:hypothetical protein
VLDELVLEEQAPTNRPVSSANAASDMVIFFFIYCFLLDATKLTLFLLYRATHRIGNDAHKFRYDVPKKSEHFLCFEVARISLSAGSSARER